MSDEDFWRLDDFFTGFHAHEPTARQAKQDFLIDGALQSDPDFQQAVRLADLQTQERYLAFHRDNELYMDQKITEARAQDDVTRAQLQRSYQEFVDDCIEQLRQLDRSRSNRNYRPNEKPSFDPADHVSERVAMPKVGTGVLWVIFIVTMGWILIKLLGL